MSLICCRNQIEHNLAYVITTSVNTNTVQRVTSKLEASPSPTSSADTYIQFCQYAHLILPQLIR